MDRARIRMKFSITSKPLNAQDSLCLALLFHSAMFALLKHAFVALSIVPVFRFSLSLPFPDTNVNRQTMNEVLVQ